MNYLLDTNLIIIYTKDSKIAAEIEHRYNLFSAENKLSVSVVTIGELNAIIKKLKLGERRQKLIQDLLENMVKVDIHFEEVIDSYGDIDAYSQGKLNEHPTEFSARNMGKNDLWIAATASAFDLTLITTDKDFNHLKDKFIKLEYVDIQEIRAMIK